MKFKMTMPSAILGLIVFIVVALQSFGKFNSGKWSGTAGIVVALAGAAMGLAIAVAATSAGDSAPSSPVDADAIDFEQMKDRGFEAELAGHRARRYLGPHFTAGEGARMQTEFKRRLHWLQWGSVAGLLVLIAAPNVPGQAAPNQDARGKTSYDQVAPVLVGQGTFAEVMAKDKADKGLNAHQLEKPKDDN